MVTNSELKNRALDKLRGNWGQPVLATFIFLLIVGALSGSTRISVLFGGFSGIAYLLIVPVLDAGFALVFLSFFRKDEESQNGLIDLMFKPFSEYSRYLGTMLLVVLYTFLWTLLLIVPGIIKTLSYSLTPYILKDNPNMQYNQAIELSMKMMDGHKTRLFVLCLSFIGWFLLSCLTAGIGFLWLIPYANTTLAVFYENVKEDYLLQIQEIVA